MKTLNRLEPDQRKHGHRPWSRRRNALGVRNIELIVISTVALVTGAAVTIITALIGVQ